MNTGVGPVVPVVQVPNISRTEYTLVDINEEGFVSSACMHVQLTWQIRTSSRRHAASSN